MPRIVIDDNAIVVKDGTPVIDAAAQLGIIIPRFCYHPALGAVGACRVCAVKFVDGPVKGVDMSCMTAAQEGMVVSTTDREAVEFRRYIIEWLMMNHPHDCPVCDEGGHCLLQDMTVAGGHGIRRYQGKKRTYHDQDIGPLIQHEMNRCIHCWRCRRFYQEFAGYRDLGALQIANRTYFGRFKSGNLNSPFSGNLIDICPTGVFTDKPARFKGRRWDWQRSPSLCIHCSLGCNTVVSARYREVIRLEARYSQTINGYFMCDRGRFGFSYTNHPERPWHALIDSNPVPLESAISAAATKLSLIQAAAGPQAISSHGSARSSLETQAVLKQICALLAWNRPTYFTDSMIQRTVTIAASRVDVQTAATLRDVEQADFILAIGVDPENEAPMLALAMRQAFRNGAVVTVIDPRPVSLPLKFEHLAADADGINCCLSALIKETVPRSAAAGLGAEAITFYDNLLSLAPLEARLKNSIAETARRLKLSRRPVVLCGTAAGRSETPAFAADLVLLLRAMKQQAGLFCVLPGANSFAASLLASDDRSFADTLACIESGAVKALLLVESDPLRDFADRQRLERALGMLDLLLVLDYLPSAAAGRAHIFFPTATLFETGGGFVNQGGIVQFVLPVHSPGIPLAQINSGDHPPRRFRSDAPGGDIKPAWQILRTLAEALSPGQEKLLSSYPWEAITQATPAFSGLLKLEDTAGEVPLIHAQPGCSSFRPYAIEASKKLNAGKQFELFMVDWTFGTEELSSLSASLKQVEKKPCMLMHPDDGKSLGIKDSDRITLQLDGGTVEADVRFAGNMASGVIILPRHRSLSWQKIRKFPALVTADRIVAMKTS
jgi:NADH-quinone oxidoreductase subunit G